MGNQTRTTLFAVVSSIGLMTGFLTLMYLQDTRAVSFVNSKICNTQDPFKLGNCAFYDTTHSKELNNKLALGYWEKASETNSNAQFVMGLIHEFGHFNYRVDPQRAFYFYNLSHTNGNCFASLVLSNFYEFGIGVSKNEEMFRELHLKGSECSGFKESNVQLMLLRKNFEFNYSSRAIKGNYYCDEYNFLAKAVNMCKNSPSY